MQQAERIVARAFDYRNFILNWRQAHGPTSDIPVRDLVTTVADWSHSYVYDRFTSVLSTPWPFIDPASVLYVADKASATWMYTSFPGNDEFTRPLLEEGVAAIIAFLTSAAERTPDQIPLCEYSVVVPSPLTPNATPTPYPTIPLPPGARSVGRIAAAPRSAGSIACVGDCNTNNAVTVDELMVMINVALGTLETSRCPSGDADEDGQITIAEIIQAVNNALNGCSGTPAATPTATPTVTPASLEDCADRVRTEVRGRDLSALEGNLLYQQLLMQERLADPSEAPDDAEALFLGSCLNIDNLRFAEMLVARDLDSSAYLGLVRDRTAKGLLAKRTRGYVRAYAAGDADADCVPDSLDECPGTPPNTVTDEHGCPDPRNARPQAGSDEERAHHSRIPAGTVRQELPRTGAPRNAEADQVRV